MNSDTEHSTSSRDADVALDRILATDLGEPSPVADYHRPLADEVRARLASELSAVERDHAAAAARLPNLYAG